MIDTELRDRIQLLAMGAVLHASSFDTAGGRRVILQVEEITDALVMILGRLLAGGQEAQTPRGSRHLGEAIGQQLATAIAAAQAEFGANGSPFASNPQSITEH
jgi:hypothetical protein